MRFCRTSRSASVWAWGTRVGSLLCVLAVAGACDEGVDPTLGTEQVFTLWGALDPTTDQQAIRVVPIQDRLNAATDAIDAEVVVTDRASGERIAFRDSLVTFDNGTQGHVFVADWTPQVGQTYQVSARRTADDQTATAEVRIPDAVVPTVALGAASNREVTYEARAPGAPRVRFGELSLRFQGLPGTPDDTVSVVLSSREAVDLFDGTWGRDINFVSAVQAYLREEDLPVRVLSLVDATYRFYVTNAEWVVPEGGFDLDQIVEPGTVSNITNGFGFIGAGYWASATWIPALSTQVRAGFFVADDPASQVVINEISADGRVELYNPTVETVSISRYGLTAALDGRPPSNPFPVGTVIGPKDFFVVDLGIEVGEGTEVFFVSPEGSVVGGLFVDQAIGGPLQPPSYGSYPDGFSFVPAQGLPDIFRGGVESSMGEANEVWDKLFRVNEVFAGAGRDGFVEVERLNPFAPTAWARIGTSSSTTWFGPLASGEAGDFLLFAESGRVDLPLIGGTVFMIYQDPKSAAGRVLDVRSYGPQASGTSSGYVFNGTDALWTPGLSPTPLALNSGSSSPLP